jgi:hypothetical protein
MDWSGPELDPVDFVCAAYLGTFLLGSVERPWCDLCGGAGTGKGELMRMMEDYERSHVRHHMTESAFASAFRDDKDPDKDPSLLKDLSYESKPVGPKVLLLPELTSFLAMRYDKVAKFFSDLRAAFDGKFDIQAGNIGKVSHGKLNFGYIAGCTEALDLFRRRNQTLGERTLVCRIARHLSGYEAQRNLAHHAACTDRIKKEVLRARIMGSFNVAMTRAILRVSRGEKVSRDRAVNIRVGDVAHLSVIARSVPMEYNGTPYLVTHGEVPTRLPLQLLSWGDARAIFDRRDAWDEGDYQMVRRIAQDTAPPQNLRILSTIWKGDLTHGSWWTVGDLATASKVESPILRWQLKQWVLLDHFEQQGTDKFRMNPLMVEDILSTDFMKDL